MRTTSFDQPLPFAPEKNTILLMESLDYDWELIGIGTQESQISSMAHKFIAMGKEKRASYDYAGVAKCVEAARKVRAGRAKLEARKAWIAARREEIRGIIEKRSAELDSRLAYKREERSGAYISMAILTLSVLLALLLAAVIGCSEPPSTDPLDIPNPYEELYSIATVPDWQQMRLSESYEAMRAGDGFTLTPDSLIQHASPFRYAWPVDTRAQGDELWFRGGPWSFRGVYSPTISGHITEKINGRYGPIQSITFQRVR